MCRFCGKNHGSGFACPEKRKLFNRFRDMLEENADLVISLHVDKEKGLSSKDILKYLVDNLMSKYFTEEEISLIEGVSDYQKSQGGGVEMVRQFLKKKGVIMFCTPGQQKHLEETLLTNYGIINYGQSKKARDALSKRNHMKVEKVSWSKSLNEYTKRVDRLTRREKRKLEREKCDYYTGLPFVEEFGDSELMQGDFYPTIDHKLSVAYCYFKGIPVEECARRDNLCWTFRYINSKKGMLTEEQFKDTILPLCKEKLAKDIEQFKEKGYHLCD